MWASDPWSWTGLWHWTGPFNKIILLLLFILLLHAVAICCERVWRFKAATRQLPSVLRSGCRNEAGITVASSLAVAKAAHHPLARVVISALEAFQAAPAFFSSGEALDCADRALQRTASLAQAEMKEGLSTVATIGALSPFIGLAGTIIGILSSFRGFSGSPDLLRSLIASDIAVALLPTALALVVGITAYAAYNHLLGRMQRFDIEIMTVKNDVLGYLHRRIAERAATPPVTTASSEHDWESSYDTHRVLFLSIGGVWLYVLWFFVLAIYWSVRYPNY